MMNSPLSGVLSISNAVNWVKPLSDWLMLQTQRSEARPYAGLSSLKVKETLIVIQMVQTLQASANIVYVCTHKNVLTMFQQKLHLVVNSKTEF